MSWLCCHERNPSMTDHPGEFCFVCSAIPSHRIHPASSKKEECLVFLAISAFQITASQREEHTDHGTEREISAIIMKAGRHDMKEMFPD